MHSTITRQELVMMPCWELLLPPLLHWSLPILRVQQVTCDASFYFHCLRFDLKSGSQVQQQPIITRIWYSFELEEQEEKSQDATMHHEQPTGTFDYSQRFSHSSSCCSLTLTENQLSASVWILFRWTELSSFWQAIDHQECCHGILLLNKIWLLCKSHNGCFGGQSPEGIDVSTCESSFSLLNSPSCIRVTSPSSPPPSPLSLPLPLTFPPSHSPPLTSIASSSSHGRVGTAQKPRVLPKVGFGLRPPPPTHPSSSICRHLKIFLIVFLREMGGIFLKMSQ